MAADFSQPLLGAVLGFSMGTVLHEFGHVLCARAVGLPIARCVIGRGPLLLSWRQGGTEFEIHASLVGGQTYPYPTFRRQKAAELTLVFGGVLGNVVTILLAIALGAFCRLPAGIGAVIVLVQLYLIATNLYPRRFRIGGKEIDSDGLLIRKLLTQKDGEAFALGPAYLAELRRYDPGVAEDTVVASSRAPLILVLVRPSRADVGCSGLSAHASRARSGRAQPSRREGRTAFRAGYAADGWTAAAAAGGHRDVVGLVEPGPGDRPR